VSDTGSTGSHTNNYTNSHTNRGLAERWAGALMPTVGAPDLALVRGEGARVWDAEGNEYHDFLSGVSVNVLGHAHPAVVEAVSRQIAVLGHVSNLFVSEPAVTLAERLLEAFGRDGRVFFCNSGAEANEAAFKIARRTGRPGIVAAEGGFHGRTLGALALTGQPAKRAPFEPLPGGVSHVPFGDETALAAAVSKRTAAVLLEPIQGENGVLPAPGGYLAAARRISAEHGALLMLDEVQTGIGRTGAMFAHQAAPVEAPEGRPLDIGAGGTRGAGGAGAADGVAPDVVTLAKGLGGGLPLGACVAFGPAAHLLAPGQHASTFGGNPVACAAALAVLDTLAAEGLPGRARALGADLMAAITKLGHPLVSEVRGSGLLIGVVLRAEVAAAAQRAARRAGFLVNAVAPHVLRLAPPLVVGTDQVERLLDALPGILTEAEAQAGGGVVGGEAR
jgi:acetylornithine/N-succinyldiaminopimelate aminotransferase